MIPWALLPVGVTKDDETPFILSLDDHLDGEYGLAYLRTVVCSETAQKVRLELGSSAGLKVWLNGELVHKYNSDQDCTPNFEQVEVNLKEGRNKLLLKVVQGRGHWEVCARFRMGDDAPVPGLRFEPMENNFFLFTKKERSKEKQGIVSDKRGSTTARPYFRGTVSVPQERERSKKRILLLFGSLSKAPKLYFDALKRVFHAYLTAINRGYAMI